MSAEAARWSCTRCGVSVGRIDGEAAELPETWSRSAGETYFLSCSRARAGEAALESAPAATPREERVRLRRVALIEFEIGRAPEAPNRTIALACRTSNGAVATVREGMERSPGAALEAGARSGA